MIVLASLRMFLAGMLVIMKNTGSREATALGWYFELCGCEATKHILPLSLEV